MEDKDEMQVSRKEDVVDDAQNTENVEEKEPISEEYAPQTEEPEEYEETTEGVTSESLCNDILVEGYVQSYVDFFYLMQKSKQDGEDTSFSNQEGEVGETLAYSSPSFYTARDMMFIKERLTTAERARRTGATEVVFDCYDGLASYFTVSNQAETGIYFYEKCLEIARLTANPGAEMKANLNLGLTYQSINKMETAVEYHERHLSMATEGKDIEQEILAKTELFNVYKLRAQELEQKEGRILDDIAKSVVYHEKCVDIAKEDNTDLERAAASFRLGRALVMLNKPDKAVLHLMKYLKLCKEKENIRGEGQTCAVLAVAFQKLGKVDNAIEYLQQSYRIACDSEDLEAQAEACRWLGVVFHQNGQFDEAVKNFEKNYEVLLVLCKNDETGEEGYPQRVENARMLLGIALGNARYGSYIHMIQQDLSNLLKWRNKKLYPVF